MMVAPTIKVSKSSSSSAHAIIQKTLSENCDSSGRVDQSPISGHHESVPCSATTKTTTQIRPHAVNMSMACAKKTLGMAQHVAAEIQVKARAIGKAVVNHIEALGDDKEFSNTELHVHLNHELGEKCGIALQGSGTASIKTLFSDEGCADTGEYLFVEIIHFCSIWPTIRNLGFNLTCCDADGVIEIGAVDEYCSTNSPTPRSSDDDSN